VRRLSRRTLVAITLVVLVLVVVGRLGAYAFPSGL
jgi:hypothetical protein